MFFWMIWLDMLTIYARPAAVRRGPAEVIDFTAERAKRRRA